VRAKKVFCTRRHESLSLALKNFDSSKKPHILDITDRVNQ
jgi:hypothetical protein